MARSLLRKRKCFRQPALFSLSFFFPLGTELVHENQLMKTAVTERSQDIATIASKIESVIDEQQRAAESIAWGMQQVQVMREGGKQSTTYTE